MNARVLTMLVGVITVVTASYFLVTRVILPPQGTGVNQNEFANETNEVERTEASIKDDSTTPTPTSEPVPTPTVKENSNELEQSGKGEAKEQNSKEESGNGGTSKKNFCYTKSTWYGNYFNELNIRVHDKVRLEVSYKPSTGYKDFPPIYNKKVFRLVKTEKIHKNASAFNEPVTGGDAITVRYYFEALKPTSSTTIKVGIYRPWEPEKKTIQHKLEVSVTGDLLPCECHSEKVIEVDKSSITLNLHCGDTIVATVEYKPSTGYHPFEPVYDSKYVKFVGSYLSINGSNLPGGDSATKVYVFQFQKKVASTRIQLGIQAPGDGGKKQVQRDITIHVQ